MSMEPTPAAALLERYLEVDDDDAPEAWRRYVQGVRTVAKDPRAGGWMRREAQRLLADGLDEDRPQQRPRPNDDPEGFGMDEPAEGDVQ